MAYQKIADRYLTTTSFDEAGFTQLLVDRCHAFTPSSARSFGFGDLTLQVIFIGEGNHDFFTKAIAHRESSSQPDGLTVFVINYKTSGVMLPPPCWDWQQADGHGTIHGLAEGYAGLFQQDTGLFTWIAYAERLAIVWTTDLAALPEWERSFPFRYVLHKWFENDNRYVLVHAGAVGTSAGGVLLTGRGGSGKSTSTLACLQSKLQYAGDDFVMVDLDKLVVHSLYNVAKLDPANLSRFPVLQSLTDDQPTLPSQKLQFYLHQHYPDAVTKGFPLKAIMLPHFTGNITTTIRPATSAEALKALAPSTLALLRADQRTFQKMACLVQKLPLFWLETGTNLAQIPAAIYSILQSLPDYAATAC
ncbi:phosphoenolpyruvate carboxykinase (ATP) [Spirosoma gilvum]